LEKGRKKHGGGWSPPFNAKDPAGDIFWKVLEWKPKPGGALSGKECAKMLFDGPRRGDPLIAIMIEWHGKHVTARRIRVCERNPVRRNPKSTADGIPEFFHPGL